MTVAEVWVDVPLFGVPQGRLTRDDLRTPPYVFEALGLMYDLDVCAPAGGVPWLPAARHYSMADDGLSQPWYGRVWMNPPFSNTAPWVRRFMAHRNGVALLPHSRAHWHAELWADADAICSLETASGLFNFVGHDGGVENIYMPTTLVAYGADCVAALKRVGPTRVLSP